MPELPEVETIRKGLEQYLLNQAIEEIEIDWPKTMPYSRDEIEAKVLGKKVKALERRAKVLIWHLDNGYSLLFHLKMTGQMVLARANGERFAGGHPTESMAHLLPDSSTRAVFGFKGGDRLFFNDQRKFGWIKLVESKLVDKDLLIARLGPEPLSKEFTAQYLVQSLQRRSKSPVKAILLDQSVVSGVGNIYADESLHLARIHPARLGGSLGLPEVKRLQVAVQRIIDLGINCGGTSFTNYVNALGQKGDYLQFARVFRRQGQLCRECGSVIEKIRVAGRGTHVCPTCQKAC